MDQAKPLPQYLVTRYQGWKATGYEDNKSWFKHLADEGQHPRAMVISCCDSRVHITSIFGAETGEFFIHRNIANLVPPYSPDGDYHGTSAAIEYAVQSLHVAHIIVMGHSGCGGVKLCHELCSGQSEIPSESSFVARWIDILEPGYERLSNGGSNEVQISSLEKQGVLVSLQNLMTFPFVQQKVMDDSLSLHGLWNDIGDGVVEAYDPKTASFVPLT